jgi:hypothetical protein
VFHAWVPRHLNVTNDTILYAAGHDGVYVTWLRCYSCQPSRSDRPTHRANYESPKAALGQFHRTEALAKELARLHYPDSLAIRH